MRKREMWAGIGRKRNFFQNRAQIQSEFLEIRYVAATGISGDTLGPPLPAPIEGDNVKSALAQVLDHFKVFFDKFSAPLQKSHGAAPRPAGLRPVRVTYLNAVWCRDEPGLCPVRHRVVGNFNETHDLI